MITFASKEDLKLLENLLKQLRSDVDSNTSDISRIMDLINNLKAMPSGNSGSGGGSSNEIMLLRSRVEYCESSIKDLKKLF